MWGAGPWGHWGLDPLSRAVLSGAKGPLEVSSCRPQGWVLTWAPQGEFPAAELFLREPRHVPTVPPLHPTHPPP